MRRDEEAVARQHGSRRWPGDRKRTVSASLIELRPLNPGQLDHGALFSRTHKFCFVRIVEYSITKYRSMSDLLFF